jgi:hypothetical protein
MTRLLIATLGLLAALPAQAETVRVCARNGSSIAASATIEFVSSSGGTVSTSRSGTIARDQSFCAYGSTPAAAQARVRWHNSPTTTNWICSNAVNPLRAATSTLRGTSTSNSCSL